MPCCLAKAAIALRQVALLAMMWCGMAGCSGAVFSDRDSSNCVSQLGRLGGRSAFGAGYNSPEPMVAGLSSGVSDMSNTCALAWAGKWFNRPPPLMWDKWLRMALMLLMGRPLASSHLLVRCKSSMLTRGCSSMEDVPPEMRNRMLACAGRFCR